MGNNRGQFFKNFLLFFFGVFGFSALIFQVVFARNLVLLFGLTAPAIATVLAVYFSGLAIGSLVFGKIADRISEAKNLKLYSLLFITTAVYGFLFPLFFKLLNLFILAVNKIYPLSFSGFNFFAFAFSFLFLIFPAIVIGAGFPVLNKILIRQEGEIGKKVSLVYFIETFGSVLGAATAGFWLIPSFGNNMTIFIASGLNVVVGGLLFAFFNKWVKGDEKGNKRVEEKSEETGNKIFLYALFATGFLALALEVFYTKTLILFIGSSTYAFSLILITFLLGIALGSWVLSFFADRIKRGYAYFGVFLGLIGFWLFLTYQFFEKLPFWFLRVLGSYESFEFGGTLLSQSLITFLVIFPATFLTGIIFPLGIKLAGPDMQKLGSGIGKLYFANTFGGVLGSLVAGFWLLPVLGYSRTLTLILLAYLALAGVFIIREKELGNIFKGVFVFFLVFWAVFNILSIPWSKNILTSGFFPYAQTYLSFDEKDLVEALKSDEILFYKEGQSNIAIIRRAGEKFLRINGKTDAGNSLGDLEAEILIGALPMLFHPEPKDVLAIGLGSGITLGTITQFDSAQNIDMVEINPEIIKAAKYFKDDNHDALTDPRVKIIAADGRNHLLLNDKKYDVISSEPSNLWVSGNAHLFTKEFYELAKTRLKSDGIMLQWLHLYSLDMDGVASVLKTFSFVFPQVYLFQTMGAGDLLILGSEKSEPLFDFNILNEKLSDVKIQAELGRIYLFNPYDLTPYLVASEDGIKELVKEAKIHSDQKTFLEFTSPKFIYREDAYSRIIKTLAFIHQKENPLARIAGRDEEKLKKYFSFSQKLFPFKASNSEGDLFGAIDAYVEAKKEGPSQYIVEAYLVKRCIFTAQIIKQTKGDDAANQVWEKCGAAFHQITIE